MNRTLPYVESRPRPSTIPPWRDALWRGRSGFGRCGYATSGFTLMEILVAMAILGISLVTILQLFSGGLKASKVSGDYTRAILHAREKMEEILLTDDFAQATLEGDFADGFGWRAEVLRLQLTEEGMPAIPIDLLEIRLRVFWHDGRKEKHFEMSTLRAAEPQNI